MTRVERMSERGWSVPLAVSQVPATGRHVDLVADERTRAAVAKLAGLVALPRLAAHFDVSSHGGGGLHVVGRVSATVGQTCVVTLEPIENEIDEPIDLVFALASAPSLGHGGGEVEVPMEDAPEPLVGGRVDLGAIATEFLVLGLDPYPRKPDAVFHAPPSGDDSEHAFAALAALNKGKGGKQR
jgi:Large ribosomal RNA subunit accumulation protein YceD